jgi:ferredoxin
MALDHLMSQAPAALPEAIALPAKGSPFGSLTVNADSCTLCLSCVSACPASALQDNPTAAAQVHREKLRAVRPVRQHLPRGRDHAAAAPAARRQAQRAARAQRGQPYQCIRCSKPFGTLKAIEAMLGKLAGHAMFQGRAAERLKMCGDCRVIDLYSAIRTK